MILRRIDWPQRLSTYINERRSMPYAYGTNDCGSFVVDGIAALTGRLLVPMEDRPTSQFAAAKFLVPFGGSVETWMDTLLGTRLPTPKLAQRGDVVSFEAAGEFHLALVAGTDAATPGESEILWVRRALWHAGWKVG